MVSLVVGASAMVEVFESKDMDEPPVVPCARCSIAGPLELGSCETFSLPVFVVAVKISLRLRLLVWVSWDGEAQYLEMCFPLKKRCAGHF